eukprot:GHVS01003425.1.p1 GENE.GHVS01003425.1~~GHVS01003425.1.p1  ORF type:complete len:100 (+),score=22.06 GHVS01003425.1:48-347(+)
MMHHMVVVFDGWGVVVGESTAGGGGGVSNDIEQLDIEQLVANIPSFHITSLLTDMFCSTSATTHIFHTGRLASLATRMIQRKCTKDTTITRTKKGSSWW